MFFTQTAKIIALAGLVVGIAQIIIGLAVASNLIGANAEALAKYTTSATTGEAIDKGVYCLVAAMLLGTAVEIAFLVRRLCVSTEAQNRRQGEDDTQYESFYRAR